MIHKKARKILKKVRKIRKNHTKMIRNVMKKDIRKKDSNDSQNDSKWFSQNTETVVKTYQTVKNDLLNKNDILIKK